MNRYYYNKQILKTLKRQLKKEPDMRFEQNLLNIFGSLEYYRESKDTLKHLKYANEGLCAKHIVCYNPISTEVDSFKCVECFWFVKLYKKFIWKVFKI